MVKPKFEVHYSVPDLFGRTLFCIAIALATSVGATQMAHRNWVIVLLFVFSAISAGLALSSFYRLLTARGQVVVSIDATGFRDTRLTPTTIPWSAIRSLWASSYRSRKANQLAVELDPAFKRGLSIRVGANLLRWANLSFGSVYQVDVGILDAEADEIELAAKPYILK